VTVASALSDVVPGEALAEPDEDRWASLGARPEAVVSPADEAEAAAVMAWASREGLGVVPAGSGRRFGPRRMGVPYVVLTSERLCGLEIYEPADVTFTAWAGTPVRDLASELGSNRQWLPFDPPDVSERTVAGLVADGASGPLWMGYGAIRNHVLGMTVVTGDGRVLRLGGRVVKNVAGFDVLKLIVGGRGRLGFITSVCMRAFPVPPAERVLTLEAPTVAELVPAALAVGTAPALPVSCVVWAGAAGGGGARLSVRLHGAEATVEADRRTLEAHVGVEFFVSEGRGWGGDTGPSPGQPATSIAPETVLAVSVLPSRLPEAVTAVEPLHPIALSIDTYAARMHIALAGAPAEGIMALRDRVESLGGALAVERAPPGEAPVGWASRPSDAERELEHGLTRAFDPEGVLWRSAR
jgi:glycolate oxidase FAD binding subunit